MNDPHGTRPRLALTDKVMTPEQRRLWIRRVLGCPDLTPAHKTVLIALETFADYRDGTNAHPGENNLAEICGLTTRAVRTALSRGQELGLIERTAAANSRVGKAAVYRLTTTGTDVPVNSPTTGTTVPVNNLTTGTTVPVDNSTTGTAAHHDRNGHDTTTGTAVPPTLQVPSKHQSVSPGWGTSPAVALAYPGQPPARFCARHPQGTTERCGDCANARTAFETWRADDIAADIARDAAIVAARRQRRQTIDNCPDCDEYGRRLDAQRNDLPDVECDHRHLRLVGNG